jgi:hypothetical protein
VYNGEDAVYQRLNFIVDTFEKGNQADFARRIGVRSGVVGDMFGKRRNKPSFDVLGKIASAYPQLRVEWLLTGEGDRLKRGTAKEESMEYFQSLLTRPHIKDRITPPTENEVAERPDPEVDWRQRLEARLHAIAFDAGVKRNDPEYIQGLIREVYEIITPDIIERAATGERNHWYALEWYFPFTPNARRTWGIIREIPIGLYPHYPVMQYFIDFADPYRRIAVFIEEKKNPWQPDSIDYQDRLLIMHGWKIFRIPLKVADTYESDLLPEHLVDVYDLGAKSKEQLIERKTWDAELSRKTLDGFLRWLKNNYFQKETITSIHFREQDLSDWDESEG